MMVDFKMNALKTRTDLAFFLTKFSGSRLTHQCDWWRHYQVSDWSKVWDAHLVTEFSLFKYWHWCLTTSFLAASKGQSVHFIVSLIVVRLRLSTASLLRKSAEFTAYFDTGPYIYLLKQFRTVKKRVVQHRKEASTINFVVKRFAPFGFRNWRKTNN